MAVQSHSFQGNFDVTDKTEKISLRANPVPARKGDPITDSTADAFPLETKNKKIKDGELQRMQERVGSQDRGSASDRDCRSRSVSTATRSRSSSVTSGSSYSSGHRGDWRNRRRSYYPSSSSSSSRSRSRSRSRPRPRCHRAPAHSRCCRGRRRSPPRRYRARSRSYSPSYSPVRRPRRRTPVRSRSPARSRLRLTASPERRAPTRSRSRPRAPDATSVRLSLQEKRQLLLIARENAARALGVEDVALPASVSPVLGVPQEPAIAQPVRPGGSALSRLQENYNQADAELEVPCPKMSARSKISFSINNSVARPVAGRSPSSPEKAASLRSDSAAAQNPYGHWVPVTARSFPLSALKGSTARRR